jgi:hypothetical protein
VDFHEIWLAGDAIEDDRDATLFNSVASIVQKWQTF